MFDYYMHRRSHPFAEIPVVIKQRRNAWKQAAGAQRVWLVDRKSGRRFARVKRDLEKRGVVAWDRAWNERVRVVELDLTRPPTPKQHP